MQLSFRITAAAALRGNVHRGSEIQLSLIRLKTETWDFAVVNGFAYVVILFRSRLTAILFTFFIAVSVFFVFSEENICLADSQCYCHS